MSQDSLCPANSSSTILERVKTEILADIRHQQAEMQKALTAQIKLLSTVIDKIHKGVVQSAIEAKSRDLGGLTKKRKVPDPPSPMSHLEVLLNPDQGVKEHLVYSMLLTVASFSFRHVQFQGWLSANIVSKMEPLAGVLKGSSGFAVLFFECRKDFGAMKFQTRVAALWSLALRGVLSQKVALAKGFIVAEAQRLGSDSPRSHVPDWLSSFGTQGGYASRRLIGSSLLRKIRTVRFAVAYRPCRLRIARRICISWLLCSRDWSSRRSKDSVREEKRRKMGLTGDHDANTECHVHAILSMRTRFMTKLTTARNEARKILYKDLFFVVEQIARYESPEIAMEHGYEIAFNPGKAPKSCGCLADYPV